MIQRILAAAVLAASLCALPLLAQDRDTVRQTQQALKDKGYYSGQVDGINGPQTRDALHRYQQKENLNEDGQIGPKTMDSLGVRHGSASTEFHESGENVKHSYSNGGKAIGQGSKAMGHDVKHGDVVNGGKDFGEGVGHGAKDIGVGTGHAVKNAAKGAKTAVTGDKDDNSKR